LFIEGYYHLFIHWQVTFLFRIDGLWGAHESLDIP